jgi:hypothetical protein
VHSDNSEWTDKAKDILERTGAEEVLSTGEAKADYFKTDKPLPRASAVRMKNDPLLTARVFVCLAQPFLKCF